MRKLFGKLFVTIMFATPAVAAAAPWCLMMDGQENCRYIALEECYSMSNRIGGYCKPNARERGVVGRGPYCVITGGQKNCSFRSRAYCLTKARALNGGCVRNTELDLARRAAGEARVDACFEGTVDCGLNSLDSAGGLAAAGYGSPDAGGGDAPLQSFEPIETFDVEIVVPDAN